MHHNHQVNKEDVLAVAVEAGPETIGGGLGIAGGGVVAVGAVGAVTDVNDSYVGYDASYLVGSYTLIRAFCIELIISIFKPLLFKKSIEAWLWSRFELTAS